MEEYLKDLEKAMIDRDSFYWQEDMQVLIDIIRGMQGNLRNRIEDMEKIIKENKGHTHTLVEASIVRNELEEILMKGEKLYEERI